MLVYIKPLSVFPILHSDTIFGAILSAISELYPNDIDDIVSKFQDNPPFIVSSAFPYIFNETDKIRFFPKIIETNSKSKNNDLNEGIVDSSDVLATKKKFKTVEFIEEDLFFKLASGNIKEYDIINDLNNRKYSILNKNLLLENDARILEKQNKGFTQKYKKTITPQNTINRITLESEAIFYSEGFEFINMGLFFLIDFKEKEYENILTSSIRFLKDRGFGRDISTGKGHFDYEIDNNYRLPDINGDYFITLSRFIPSNEDLNKINEFSGYEIDSKRGKSPFGEIRKQIRFFKEGSSFPYYKKFYGKIVESGKNSPSIEYGYAFPMKYNKGSD